MPSPSMKTSSFAIDGYWRSGPTRYHVPFKSRGTEPLMTSSPRISDSTRSGAPQPLYNGISGNATSIHVPLQTMNDTIRLARELRTLSPEITPASITATTSLVAPLHRGRGAAGERITRDACYGPAPRHRLDIFEPEQRGDSLLPVLVFVHGGGFTMGDKTAPGSPMYDNVGLWAVRNGFIGVNITYRLAPAAQWPAGSDDVSAAVNWVRENIAAHGGNAEKIFVMG